MVYSKSQEKKPKAKVVEAGVVDGCVEGVIAKGKKKEKSSKSRLLMSLLKSTLELRRVCNLGHVSPFLLISGGSLSHFY